MTKETKVVLHNPENPNSGYTIENPYATKIKFITELNYWFNTKKTYRFWRKALRPMYEEMGVHKHQRKVRKDMDF